MRTHRPPTTCPVCSESLIGLRLGCPACGTELSGRFDTCRFCRLDGSDLTILEVFLRGRGNIRDVQAHLGVSYPTARARLTEVLDRLGLTGQPESVPDPASGTGPEPGTSGVTGPGPGPSPSRAPGPGGSTGPGPARGPGMGGEVATVLADLAAGRIDVDQAQAQLEAP